MKNERKKQDGAHNETMCTKATESQIRKVKRLAKRKKQTVSKTINDLIEMGLTQTDGNEQGVVPRGE